MRNVFPYQRTAGAPFTCTDTPLSGDGRSDPHQAAANRLGGGLGAVLNFQLGENAADVLLHRVLANAQLGGDRLVRIALRHQGKDFQLARRDLGLGLARVEAARQLLRQVAPALRDGAPIILPALIIGLMAYGTYEFTSWAVMRDWHWQMVVTDTLWGGNGRVVYGFSDRADFTPMGSLVCDVICDFTRGEDIIDLSGLAKSLGGALHFSTARSFSGGYGELIFDQRNNYGFLLGDLNGDRNADFRIRVDGVASFAASDLRL